MLDLKELERRLDDALANETSESLTKWLFDQRKKSKSDLESFFGKGSLKSFEERPISFSQGTLKKYLTKENHPSPIENYDLAA